MTRPVAGIVQPSAGLESAPSFDAKRNSAIRRALSIAFSTLLSLVLFGLLFLKLGISLNDLGLALARTPWWLMAFATAAAFVIQIITSYRWKVAIEWLSPSAPHIGFRDLLKATTIGTALGQVLPLQISLSLGRWWSVRHARGNWVIGTTLFEQMFDLVVLCAGGIGAVFALTLAASPAVSLTVFAFAVACGTLGVRQLFSASHWILARLARATGFGQRIGARLSGPLATAKDAPTKVLVVLGTASIAKLLMLVLRAVAIASVFAPAARLWTVAVGFPLIGLAVANPVMPGGFGVAEWSWTGLLVLAGCAATAAGVTAIMLKILNLATLGIVLLVLAAVDLVRGRG